MRATRLRHAPKKAQYPTDTTSVRGQFRRAGWRKSACGGLWRTPISPAVTRYGSGGSGVLVVVLVVVFVTFWTV